MPKSYISTSIPYVNGSPHIGFALEIIQADVIARYSHSIGEDVFFLTGTDENSLKNVRVALDKGVDVKELVDKNAKKYLELKDIYSLSFNDFIRTTEKRHFKGVEKLWKACEKDIYKKTYQGLYCVGCEAFYKEKELKDGLCPDHKKKPELIEEENYFFKLSKYQEEIKELILSNKLKIVPETRRNEILSLIDSGIEDICISRSKERAHGWGIPVPGDSSQVVWVWFDALSNYINGLGYGEDSKKFNEWWNKSDNRIHMVGKGVIRFHALYWIGMLLSAKITLPTEIFVHGYITSNGEKMSKSLGNVVSPLDLAKKYDSDAVRYFLLREIPPFKDGDFTEDRFVERYNSDLAKGLGNLFSRVLSVAQKIGINNKYLDIKEIESSNFQLEVDKTKNTIDVSLKDFEFNRVIKSIWKLISFCDQYIEKEKIWEKSEKQEKSILILLYAMSEIAKMLKPFLPKTSDKIRSFVSLEMKKDNLYFDIKKIGVLFPKIN